jgi:hypothetical protein
MKGDAVWWPWQMTAGNLSSFGSCCGHSFPLHLIIDAFSTTGTLFKVGQAPLQPEEKLQECQHLSVLYRMMEYWIARPQHLAHLSHLLHRNKGYHVGCVPAFCSCRYNVLLLPMLAMIACHMNSLPTHAHSQGGHTGKHDASSKSSDVRH